MKSSKVTAILLLMMLSLARLDAFGQEEEENDPQERQFTIDTPVTIDLKDEEEDETRVAAKDKKVKKRVFYGIKTKKGFTKKGFGDNTVLELFHYIKDYQEPDQYVQEIYWYDFKRKQIRKTKRVNREFGVILHGPYKKMRGEQVIEEGIYFVGTKHGRWMTYDRHDVLQDKLKFYKGWPKESLVKYYDEERTKLKEVVPIVFGKKEGMYYYFFENGDIAVQGRFENDMKVGKWTEFYPTRSRRKKEIIYPESPWDKVTKPYISKEWNIQGRIIYDYNVYLRGTS